jgi:hypothetical protein
MPSQGKKATFYLPADLLAALDELLPESGEPSKNALVERALTREVQELRRQVRRRRWHEASRDPLLLKDIQEVEADFAEADAETARRIR